MLPEEPASWQMRAIKPYQTAKINTIGFRSQSLRIKQRRQRRSFLLKALLNTLLKLLINKL